MSNGLIGALTGGIVATLYTHNMFEGSDKFATIVSATFGVICGIPLGAIGGKITNHMTSGATSGAISGAIVGGVIGGLISGKITEDKANGWNRQIHPI